MIDAGEYREALQKAALIEKAVSEANMFRLPFELDAASKFYSDLRKRQPEIYLLLRLHKKRIDEVAIAKRTGEQMTVD